ncbi:glycine N-acyltransferase-like protein 3 isoform X4 [Cuculus canorus]|uniref:glycine N-acyltransferase-like protein 3 isoform X4 n=1 Tax=Cuculus canorus TaxID=55661 RepID=UPI0023AA97CE|nr:glycine N-acyltransferase-like protein 3 isoform X4 [Cuculus canorus]
MARDSWWHSGTHQCHCLPHRSRDLLVSPPAPQPPRTHSWCEILTCPAKLQSLEATLRRSLPLSLPVYGAVMHINRGNPGEMEVAVDSWPDFGAVLARQSGEMPVDDSYKNTHAAFYRDLGAYRALLETPGCVRWDSAFHIIGLQDGLATTSQALAATKGVELDISEFYTFLHPDPSTIPEPRLPPNIRVGSLSVEHAELLTETWPYGGTSRSRQYLVDMLSRLPNLCLQDETRYPVCWVLTDHFGTGAHGYTLRAHRRHGYMRAALAITAKRAHARGFPSYGHTAPGNVPMQRLQEGLGHQRLPELCRFILHNPSLCQALP